MPEYALEATPAVIKSAGWASQLKRKELGKIMEAEDTPASVLLVIALDHWGTEMFDWEPDTLRMELADALGVKLPQVNLDKIWSMVTYLTTDKFFTALEVFIPTCNVLSDSEASFADFDPADMEEMAWAITELNLIDPITDPRKQFSEEIKYYVGAAAREQGLTKLPPMLAWGKFLDDPEERVEQWQDDPEFFNAIFDHQQENIKGILDYVHARLNRVITMLKDLPLLNGSTASLLKDVKS